VRIEKPFGAWNLIGMFQGEEEAAERTVSIEALGLPTDTACRLRFLGKGIHPTFRG